eukprot:gene4002-2857_t
MPLDLVGKLHRTVYVANCPTDSYQDLATLMMRRSGAVEAWEVADDRLVIVFESLNSVSNALAFNGISFADLAKQLIVWRAKDPPPAAAPQQLALTGNGEAPQTQAGDQGQEASDNDGAQRRQWLQKRQERLETLRALEAEMDRIDKMELSGRNERMKEWCVRQAIALNILLEEDIARMEEQLRNRHSELEVKEKLIKALQKDESRKREREDGAAAEENA